MDEAAKLEVLERMVDGFNVHDLDTIMSLFVDDCVFESPRGPGPWGSDSQTRPSCACAFQAGHTSTPNGDSRRSASERE